MLFINYLKYLLQKQFALLTIHCKVEHTCVSQTGEATALREKSGCPKFTFLKNELSFDQGTETLTEKQKTTES